MDWFVGSPLERHCTRYYCFDAESPSYSSRVSDLKGLCRSFDAGVIIVIVSSLTFSGVNGGITAVLSNDESKMQLTTFYTDSESMRWIGSRILGSYT